MGTVSLLIVVVFISVVFSEEKELQTRIVETKQGKVEGTLSSNELYCEFLGIRYAVPVRFRVSGFCLLNFRCTTTRKDKTNTHT